MFGSRRASQKPDDELISKFRKAFPQVISATSLTLDASDAAAPLGYAAMEQVNPIASPGGTLHDGFKVDDTTPETLQDLRFTWSFMDPHSFDYSLPLANQPQGYCPPPLGGGMDPIFHSQSSGLHTPPIGAMAMTGPPSSHVTGPHNSDSSCSSTSSNGSAMGLDNFNPQYFPGPFQNLQPFSQQGSYAPSTFLRCGSGYSPMDSRSGEKSSADDVDMQLNPSPHFTAPPADFENHMLMQPIQGEKFRYNVTLRAPTAMIKHPKEIPVTYLNKGQTYTLSVVDSSPPPINTNLVRYRTYIRVSFEEEEQRSKLAACWQLWKEGRGLSEAHQRGGKLLAVEYVDPIHGVGDEGQKDRQVQIESSSFDGFCVTWTADATTGVSYCAISVRFNFLSTDFSHSKGVKGVPVRLCAKTEMISPDNSADAGTNRDAEVCYCKVKLFRDHGAERKLSNDVAHVKKAIEKLKQQIAQAEIGAGSFGKRKRGSVSVARPAKILKYKRSWSFDAQSSSNTDGAERLSMEDDLHTRLAMMQDMFSSTRPVSTLSLRGDEQDDPDLFPVQLSGDINDPMTGKVHSLRHQSTHESLVSVDASSLSPTTSTVSINSSHRPSCIRSDSGYQSSQSSSRDNNNNNNNCLCPVSPDRKRFLDHPIKIQKPPIGGNAMSMGYIEAVDIDPTYRPPAEHPPKPIACLYVRFDQDENQQNDYYRALYLTERTVGDLMKKISEKQEIDPERIVRVLRINRNGLKVMVDDDMVRELPEGQDMVAELSHASMSTSPLGDTVEVKLKY